MTIIETERHGNGYGGYNVQCVVCGDWFESKRYDASFCGATCRSRHSRSKHELDRRIERANQSVDALIELLPRHGDSRTFTELERLTRRIQSALATVEAEP